MMLIFSNSWKMEIINLKEFSKKLKDGLTKLFEKIKDFFKNHSSAAEDEKMRKELEKVEKAKLTAIDGHKVFKHSKKYQDKIKNAKSVEEVDKIVEDYKKTTKKLTAAGAFALIFTGTGLAVYAKRKANRKSNYDLQEEHYKMAMDLLDQAEKKSKDMNKLRNDPKHGKSMKILTDAALNEVNNAEIRGKEISDNEIDLITARARAIFTIADESIVMSNKRDMIDVTKGINNDIVTQSVKDVTNSIGSFEKRESKRSIDKFIDTHNNTINKRNDKHESIIETMSQSLKK